MVTWLSRTEAARSPRHLTDRPAADHRGVDITTARWLLLGALGLAMSILVLMLRRAMVQEDEVELHGHCAAEDQLETQLEGTRRAGID